jgi:divalent metal cation (Fe/Co/Zn/Cd) transporter
VLGLMDTALPPAERDAVNRVLHEHAEGVQFHALLTRQSGARRFVSVHVLVPGAWTVHDGHRFVERIEADIRRVVPNASVLTHLESLDDPTSWDDEKLDRVG